MAHLAHHRGLADALSRVSPKNKSPGATNTKGLPINTKEDLIMSISILAQILSDYCINDEVLAFWQRQLEEGNAEAVYEFIACGE